MYRKPYFFCLLGLILVGLGGCSSGPSKDAKKAAVARERIRGKAQINLSESGSTDAAMNAGGPSVYIWEGARRYRLFLRTPFEIEGGKEYIVEGVNAQKVIDELGDPDQGKNGYPLLSSCERAVKTAWPGLAFDVTDGQASALRGRMKRYPARPVFLVTGIAAVEPKEGDTKAADAKKVAKVKDIPAVPVPADKQRALLVEGPAVLPAPLWEPAGGTVRCKVIIDQEGKIAELETGLQLCEIAPWEKFRYQPTVRGGQPVKVETEVELKFEPRKAEGAATP